ncbi:MAG: hypothetical protein GF418_09620, partial [Chitinivibrionales bacterium]|nr:hypothetical protein [Chitinivibrionales bacterium]MBD3395868.1 hypothetical protein [Chitinivibrionales bacterium]
MRCCSIRLQAAPAFLLLAAFAAGIRASDWGSIVIESGADDEDRVVTLQNSQMRVTYAHFRENTDQHAIQELYVKNYNTNLAGKYIDACADRPMLTDAAVTYEDSYMKTARLTWGTHTTADITIYRDKPFVKIDQTGNAPNIVDISNGGGNYVVYGSELWDRGFVEYPRCYYNKDDAHCTDENGEGPDSDPGSLLYNGWFIVGLYHTGSNIGWGRVMPGTVSILKLLPWHGKGFEWFWNAKTGYLFVVTAGASEVLSLGRQIADWANAGENPDDLTGIRKERMIGAQPRDFYVRRHSAEEMALHFSSPHSVRVYCADGSLVYAGGQG